MARGLKLGLGIPLFLLGLVLTLVGSVLLVLVGPDGRFTLPENVARSSARGLLFDGLSLRGIPPDGGFSIDVEIRIHDLDDADDVFVGIGPRHQVRRYLRDVAVDRLIQANWPGGVRTEPVENPGTRVPGPPADQDVWVAFDAGIRTDVRWRATDGDWMIVVMNADGSREIAVAGSVTVTIPALGPGSVIVAIVGIAMLAAGTALTVSGARMPAHPRAVAPARPDAPA